MTFRVRLGAAAVLIGLAVALLVLAGRALDNPGTSTGSSLPTGSSLATASSLPTGSGVVPSLPGAGSPGATGAPRPVGSTSTARANHTATLLRDGRVLIAGGATTPSAFATLETAGLFDPNTRSFDPAGPMTVPREGHTATLLPDGRVLIAGGHDFQDGDKTIESSAEIYDPILGMFTATGSMSAPREGHTATLLANGLVLIAGGEDTDSTALATAELFDPSTGRFTPTGSMSTARDVATATLLANGQVLIAGGSDSPLLSSTLLDSADLYDPATGTFRLTSPMINARYGQTATRLADGRVVIIGGHGNFSEPTPWAEIYDPKTETFSKTGSMITPRFAQVATLLVDGRVLVVGGDSATGTGSASYLASAELFDPRTGTFHATGSMSQPRLSPTATRLANGRVLIIGGYPATDATSSTDGSAASVELFDPATGKFSSASPVTSAEVGRATRV